MLASFSDFLQGRLNNIYLLSAMASLFLKIKLCDLYFK